MGSEFGKGLCYNLGLFLAHTDRVNRELEIYKKIKDEKRAYSMWFYGAADHLCEFQWNQAPTKSLQKRCEAFQSKVLGWRLPMNEKNNATKKDYEWAIQEAKDLLRLIDKANKVAVIKGDWE